jgi:hypothetical protein
MVKRTPGKKITPTSDERRGQYSYFGTMVIVARQAFVRLELDQKWFLVLDYQTQRKGGGTSHRIIGT